METLKKRILLLITLVAVSFAFSLSFQPATAGASNKDEVCKGAGLVTSGAGAAKCTSTSGPSVNGVIKTAINIFTIIVGLVAVVMIIVGGFKYITSGGNDTNMASAKSTLLYAVIGLTVVA